MIIPSKLIINQKHYKNCCRVKGHAVFLCSVNKAINYCFVALVRKTIIFCSARSTLDDLHEEH